MFTKFPFYLLLSASCRTFYSILMMLIWDCLHLVICYCILSAVVCSTEILSVILLFFSVVVAFIYYYYCYYFNFLPVFFSLFVFVVLFSVFSLRFVLIVSFSEINNFKHVPLKRSGFLNHLNIFLCCKCVKVTPMYINVRNNLLWVHYSLLPYSYLPVFAR